MTALTLQRRRRMPRAWRVVVVGLFLGVLASCSSAVSAFDTTEALRDAGFADAEVDFDSGSGFDEVRVTTDPGFLEGDAESLAETAAGVVWTNFPLRFDGLEVTITDSFDDYQTFYTYDELYDLFGPRPSGFDERTIGDDYARTGLVVAIVVGGGLLLFVAVAAVAIVLIVRASRRRARAVPPAWPPGSAPPQWPPSGQPPPSQQPPPAGWGRPPDSPGDSPGEPGEPGPQSWPPPPQ